MIKEIKESADPVAEMKKLSEQAMGLFTELKSEMETKKNADALQEQKLEKMSAAHTDALAKIQALQGQVAEEKKQREAIETALSRASFVGGDSSKTKTPEASRKAFDLFMRTGEVAQGFKSVGGNSIELKTLATNINPDGGYFVMPEMVDFVVGRVFETSPLRQVARVVTTMSNAIDVIIDDTQASGGWAGEGSTSSSTTTPTVGKMTINAHKLDSEPKATAEMLQDAGFNIEAWLGEKVADYLGRLENTAFIGGNGVAKPRGLLTYSAWASAGVYEREKIEQVNSGAAAALTGDGLIDLQTALKEAYQARAVFLMKRATYGKAKKLKGSDQYFFGETLLKDGIAQAQLLGKPVLFCDDMEAVAANALAIAYGDFSVGYTIVDKLGLTVLRDPFTSKGNVIFYTSKRVGGDVTNFDAIKIQKVAA